MPKRVADYAAKAHEQSVTAFLLNIIPNTLVSAFAEGDILQVLLVAILFGFALSLLGEDGKPVLDASSKTPVAGRVPAGRPS